MTTPLVSICSITYNHAPFIRQCLDGFLMQQCNFPIEIIINDDCSTDGTTEIIREYAEKYPDKIFPIFHEENLYSQGVRGMFQKFVFPKAQGKYIAICEGDDYWTDPLKLQKQVDFLESHPDYSMCCHASTIKLHDTEWIKTYGDKEDCNLVTKDVFLKGGEFIVTASICFRSDLLNGFSEFAEGCPVGDYPLQIWCAMHGKIRCLKDAMSVYRQGNLGSWTKRIEENRYEQRTLFNCHLVWLTKVLDRTENRNKCYLRRAIRQHKVNWALQLRDLRLLDCDFCGLLLFLYRVAKIIIFAITRK